MRDDRIRIFLASPSDVAAHREQAREVAAEVDRRIADPLGLRVELTGWEDLRPGYGRPQDLINPAVDECEVFVGILGKRWGQSTGAATSGFLEEYERVVARIEANERVALWVYVLELSAEDQEDPGPQLRQVLDFRDQLYRTALIREFQDAQQFARLFQAHIAELVIERHKARTVGEPEETPPAPTDARAAGTQSVELSDQASAQATRVLHAAEAVGAPSRAADSPALGAFEILRLHLLAATWLSVTLTGEVLSAHEINALYHHREDIRLQPTESELVLRTMCQHAPVAPGWAIVGDDNAAGRLLMLAAQDDRTAVRAGAIDLLDIAPIAAFAGSRQLDGGLRAVLDYLAGSNDDAEPRERLAVLLSRSDTAEALQALRSIAQPEQPGADAVIEILIAKLLNCGEFKEAIDLIDNRLSYLDSNTARRLNQAAGDVELAVLEAALDAQKRELRRWAAEELGKRSALNETACLRLLDDASLEVRVVAFEALCAQGAEVDERLFQERIKAKLEERMPLDSELVSRARRAWLGTRSAEELRQKVTWILIQTDDEYAVLAERHFDIFGDQVRRDLADSFQSFREQSINDFRARLETQAVLTTKLEDAKRTGQGGADRDEERILREAREKVDEELDRWIGKERYNRMVFAEAALRGIARNGGNADAALVRPWTDDDNRRIRKEALNALVSLGGSDDAERLANAAASSRGEEARRYASAALRLDPSVNGSAARLLSEREEVAALAARHLAHRADEVDEATTWMLINHPGDEIRRAGVACAARRLDSVGLQSLLSEYLAQDRWFYNVVWLLDRLTYAPSWLRERSLAELSHDALSG